MSGDPVLVPVAHPATILDPAQFTRIEAVHRGFLFHHLYTVQCLRSSHAELRQAGLGQVAQNIADERLPRLEPAVRFYYLLCCSVRFF